MRCSHVVLVYVCAYRPSLVARQVHCILCHMRYSSMGMAEPCENNLLSIFGVKLLNFCPSERLVWWQHREAETRDIDRPIRPRTYVSLYCLAVLKYQIKIMVVKRAVKGCISQQYFSRVFTKRLKNNGWNGLRQRYWLGENNKDKYSVILVFFVVVFHQFSPR